MKGWTFLRTPYGRFCQNQNFLNALITKFSYPWCSATNNTAIFVWPWKVCDREFSILHSGGTPGLYKPVLQWRNPHVWRHPRVISSNQRSVFTQPAATRLGAVSLFLQIPLFSCLSRLAPSVSRVVICVSRAFCSMDQEKRETARSLCRNQISKLSQSPSPLVSSSGRRLSLALPPITKNFLLAL